MTKLIKLSVIFYLFSALISSDKLSAETHVAIPMAENLASSGGSVADNSKILILYIASVECPYCRRLEKDILFPLLRNPKYLSLVDIRKINLDSPKNLVDFMGRKQTSAEFALKLQAKVTPTLLFMSTTGTELSPRLIGYQGSEFYWYQLDERVKQARKTLNAKSNN